MALTVEATGFYAYPLKSFSFVITSDHESLKGEELYCAEVGGLEVILDEIEYRNGADSGIVKHKQHGLVSYSNITLKHGMTNSIAWFQAIKDQTTGETKRCTLTIQLLNDKGEEAAAWEVHKAWPVKYTGPDLNSTSSEVAFESIEFCNEGIVRKTSSGKSTQE